MNFFHKLLVATALATLPIASASCQQLPAPVVSWSQGSASVPFELFRGNRVVAAGTINGRAVEFVLDTGAGMTTVDREFARSIGLPKGQTVSAQGVGGTVEAELVPGVSLTIGGLKLDETTVLVIDLANVSKGIGRPVPVVLGREMFDNAIVTLDWNAGQMIVARPDGFVPPAGAKLVALGRGRDTLNTIPVSINGAPPVDAHFDLGSGSALTLPKSYWESKPGLARLPYANSEAGGVGGMHGTRLVTVGKVTIAGQTFTAVPANLSEAKANHGAVDQPNVGIGLLKPFRMTMDLGRDRIFLEPLAKSPAFQRDRAGVRAELKGDALELAFVSPQSPAAAAGLKKGDRLVAVDGQPVGADFFKGPAASWNQRPAGERIPLKLADGRTVQLRLADYY
jgi:aspartyl protease/PDZ domain-containing protein